MRKDKVLTGHRGSAHDLTGVSYNPPGLQHIISSLSLSAPHRTAEIRKLLGKEIWGQTTGKWQNASLICQDVFLCGLDKQGITCAPASSVIRTENMNNWANTEMLPR